MLSWISLILGGMSRKLILWGAIAATVLVVVAGLFFKIRSDGRMIERAANNVRARKVEAKARKVEQEISRLPAPAVNDWMREHGYFRAK